MAHRPRAVADDPLVTIARERLTAVSCSLGWALPLCARRFFSVHGPLLRRIGQVSVLVTVSTTNASSFSLVPEVSRIFSELGIALEFEFISE